MRIFNVLLLTALTTTALAGSKFDKHETINGVDLHTGKDDSTRTYKGTVTKTLPYPPAVVLKSFTNFNEKCNNSYKDKRELTDKASNCKYHNDNLIESLIVRDLKSGWAKEPNEVDRFVVARRVYNRGSFQFYDLVQVFETTNPQNQKVTSVKISMLSTKESKRYVEPKFEKESAFDTTVATFTVTEVKPNESTFSYEYLAATDHWILNKEISIPQVFSSISKSINDLVKTVVAETEVQNRDVASF